MNDCFQVNLSLVTSAATKEGVLERREYVDNANWLVPWKLKFGFVRKLSRFGDGGWGHLR